MPNQTAANTPKAAIWTPALLSIVLLVADAVTPRGVALCTAYIPLIYFALRFSRARIVYVYAAIACAFTIIGALLKPPGGVTSESLLTSRLLHVAVIWWVAEVIFRYRVAKDALHEKELTAMLDEAAAKAALLASIVESSNEAIFGKSLSGIIESWNRGAERLFGYTAAEIIGKPITVLIPKDRLAEEDLILSSILTGKPIEHFETLRIHKDGSLLEVSVSVSPIKDAKGRIIGASKTVRGTGAQREIAAMLAAVVDSVVDGLITIDRVGNVRSFNRACQRIFGYVEAEVIGNNIKMLMPEPYHGEHDGYLSRFHETSEPHIIGSAGREVMGRRKDGTVFPMDLSVSQFQLGGQPHFCGIIRDITDRKLAESEAERYTRALVRSNQALDEFAYAASHDLKAPLRVIANASQWLEEDLAEHLTGENKENMELLRGRVRRMDKLLNDLLAYSRIGRKSDSSYSESVAGDSLLNDVIVLVAPPSGFVVTFDPAFAKIHLRRMPLQQVFMNLISNAIKHHDREQGIITVAVTPGETFHVFAVSDDGPGIDPRFHTRIFDMFQTLKPRDQVEGSGMGLAMVRKNVEVFGGSIAVHSDGRGSTFRFTWPAQQPDIEQTVGISTTGVLE